MATRCRIAKVQDDGTVKSIYCHWDGYPEGVGKMLLQHYTNPDKVDELVAIGNISSLHETIEETTKEHYSPDKDESARIDESLVELTRKLDLMGEEYTYVFDTDYTGVYGWRVIETPYSQDLSDLLSKRGEI